MKHRESQRKTSKILKKVSGRTQCGAVTSISVPDPDNPEGLTKIYDPKEMTDRIIKRNQDHYGQAEGSPPTDPTFVQHVGRNAQRSFEGLKECLDSDSTKFLPETIAILEYIQNNRLPPIDSLLTTEDVEKGI